MAHLGYRLHLFLVGCLVVMVIMLVTMLIDVVMMMTIVVRMMMIRLAVLDGDHRSI